MEDEITVTGGRGSGGIGSDRRHEDCQGEDHDGRKTKRSPRNPGHLPPSSAAASWKASNAPCDLSRCLFLLCEKNEEEERDLEGGNVIRFASASASALGQLLLFLLRSSDMSLVQSVSGFIAVWARRIRNGVRCGASSSTHVKGRPPRDGPVESNTSLAVRLGRPELDHVATGPQTEYTLRSTRNKKLFHFVLIIFSLFFFNKKIDLDKCEIAAFSSAFKRQINQKSIYVHNFNRLNIFYFLFI